MKNCLYFPLHATLAGFSFWLKTTLDFLGAIIIVICTAIGGVDPDSDVGGLGHGGGGEHRKGR